MPKVILNYILLFFGLVIGQAVIFNNLVLFNCAVALVFVYMLIILPITVGPNSLLTIAFLLGLSVDIFQDTPGLNAMSCTLIAFMRKSIFHLYIPRDDDNIEKRISINAFGFSAFAKFALTITVLYCIFCFSIEAINYFDINRLLLRMGTSAFFTFIVILAIESLTVKRREKRL